MISYSAFKSEADASRRVQTLTGGAGLIEVGSVRSA
jgi:hypothetical protein